MPKESNLELKVGAFVLLSMIALTIFIFSISDSSFLEKGKSVNLIFEFANGLRKNAPVRVAGVEQGIVKDIVLFFDRQDAKTKAQVEIRVKKEVKIPIDSIVMINQLGLLGEKYIEIVPGMDTKNYFEENQTYIGQTPIAQEVLSEKIMEVASKLDQTIGGVNKIITDEQNQVSVKKTLENMSFVSANFKDITGDVREGKGNLGKLLYDEGLYNDVKGLTADLKANPWKLLYRPKGK